MSVERITGEEIIEEILSNMRQGVEPLRYTVLVPALYHVYLHEKDFERLRGVFPQLIKEAKQALDEELEKHNQAGQRKGKDILALIKEKLPTGLLDSLGGKETRLLKKYQSPAEGWQISFHKDLNDDLLPGDICVQSQLSLPATIEFGAGNQTKTIKTLRRNGVAKKTVESRNQEPSMQQPVPKSPAITGTISNDENSSRTAYALIHYQDQHGQQTFEMMKNQVVIGRGGSGYWVDLVLDVDAKISREHLRLRRDEQTGKFYVKDLSTFGTTINGQPLPSSMQEMNGERRDVDLEVELPPHARIGLAGIFTLDFVTVR
jgi:hypothetical protein